jgi:hypothetical protein
VKKLTGAVLVAVTAVACSPADVTWERVLRGIAIVILVLFAGWPAEAANWQRLLRVNGADGKAILSYQLDIDGVRWQRDSQGRAVVSLPVRRARGEARDLIVWVVDVNPGVNTCTSCTVGFAPWPRVAQSAPTVLRIVVQESLAAGRYVPLAMLGEAWNVCALQPSLVHDLGRPR